MRSIVVVGASLAGLRAAEELRRQGYDGSITIVGDEPHRPYDRPPLSKQLLSGAWDHERIALTATVTTGNAGGDDVDGLDALACDWRFGTRAVGLDLVARTVTLAPAPSPDLGTATATASRGETESLAFDGLVIATGATPRRLRGVPGEGLAGIHTLRTLDDSLAIRAALDAAPGRVVVIGAGFIGAEVAATCRARGAEVTLVEALPFPLERALGPDVGGLMAEIHRDQGVDLRLGVGVAGFEGGGRVERVVLADGSRVEADVVVVGVGVAPATGWLEGSGLTLRDGVACDATGLAAPGVVAAGDVARWPSRRFGVALRVEHWDNAITMAAHAARRLLHGPADPAPDAVEPAATATAPEPGDAADPAPARTPDDAHVYDPVPWFWSDQYDRKIQLAGVAAGADEMAVVDGSFSERRFAALYRKDERVVGVLGMNRPRLVATYRRLIERSAPWDEALHALD